MPTTTPATTAIHVFAALKPGDVWESVFRPGAERQEYWLGKLDGGAVNLAGYSAPGGTQHLFVASLGGLVYPLEIGPAAWKWRWSDSVMERHDGIVGLTAYYHPGDDRQHVFAALNPGDIWESRARVTSIIASQEWSPKVFPSAIGGARPTMMRQAPDISRSRLQHSRSRLREKTRRSTLISGSSRRPERRD